MSLSVIIPVLDEEARIARRIDELVSLEGIDEIVIVDGGSDDGTWTILERARGVHGERLCILTAPRGRARQMNAGARTARGDTLLFLHADVSLPRDATAHLERALRDDGTIAGAFRTWTVADRERWRFAPLLHLADVRSRYSTLPYGDQALFLRAKDFWRAGGFPEQPLMEDLEFALRLRRLGRIQTVPARVQVSGRRFIRRPIVYTLMVNVFPLLYRAGVAPSVLASLYRNVR